MMFADFFQSLKRMRPLSLFVHLPGKSEHIISHRVRSPKRLCVYFLPYAVNLLNVALEQVRDLSVLPLVADFRELSADPVNFYPLVL